MSKMHQWIVCVAVIAATAGSAAADRYELGFGSGARWMRSKSVDTLSADDSQPVVGVTGAVRVDGIRPLGFDLYVDLEYLHEGMSGTTYQRIDSDMSMHSVRAGARLERDLYPWLSWYGRATLGYTTASLSLEDRFAVVARPTRDRAHAATSSFGGGLNLPVIRSSRVTIAMRAELDYTQTSALHFEAEPEVADEDLLTIPVMSASLGDVDVSGLSLRLGLFGRF